MTDFLSAVNQIETRKLSMQSYGDNWCETNCIVWCISTWLERSYFVWIISIESAVVPLFVNNDYIHRVTVEYISDIGEVLNSRIFTNK